MRLSAIEILINRRVCRARRFKGVLGNQRVSARRSTAIKVGVCTANDAMHCDQRACLYARRSCLSPKRSPVHGDPNQSEGVLSPTVSEGCALSKAILCTAIKGCVSLSNEQCHGDRSRSLSIEGCALSAYLHAGHIDAAVARLRNNQSKRVRFRTRSTH